VKICEKIFLYYDGILVLRVRTGTELVYEKCKSFNEEEFPRRSETYIHIYM
jgi:hypothetical protein